MYIKEGIPSPDCSLSAANRFQKQRAVKAVMNIFAMLMHRAVIRVKLRCIGESLYKIAKEYRVESIKSAVYS